MGAALTRQRTLVVAGGVIGLCGLVFGGKYVLSLYAEKKRREIAVAQMKLVGHVTKIQIYPIKSCHSIELKEADCSSLGLFQGVIKDRVFVVTDAKHHFITARQDPLLLFIKPSFHDNELWLDAPGSKTFKLVIPSIKSSTVKVRIWGQNTHGIDCGDEIGEWLGMALKRPSKNTRLVYYPWDKAERIPPDWQKWDLFQKNDSTIFGDLCPFLVINEASVKDLNSRLEKDITAQNFRPSILFKGSQPYEEDEWKYIRIGDTALFRCVRPCTRCILTTIDPETGIRSPEGEPLTTLKKYRLATGSLKQKIKEESPMFGVYFGLEISGKVKVGDPVYASV